MKKHRKPKATRYTLFHELCASPTDPLPEAWQRTQLTSMWDGLAMLETGDKPGCEDWAVCSDAVNLLETLIKQGEVEDTQGLLSGTHYTDMAIQPWKIMESVLTPEEFIGFLKGNVIKYGLRAGRKAGADDDAAKVQHYAQKLREIQA